MTPHTIVILGTALRLYPPPSGENEHPWVAFNDVLAAAEIPLKGASAWADLWLSQYPDLHAQTDDGTMIVPGVAALGLFQAGDQLGWMHGREALEEFTRLSGLFFISLHRDLDIEQFRQVLYEADLRSTPVECFEGGRQ